MTTPEEKEQIEQTLRQLQAEFENLGDEEAAPLRIRSSPAAAERLRRISEELILLSRRDKR